MERTGDCWKVEIRNMPSLTSYGRCGKSRRQAVLLQGKTVRAIGEAVTSEINRFQKIADNHNAQ